MGGLHLQSYENNRKPFNDEIDLTKLLMLNETVDDADEYAQLDSEKTVTEDDSQANTSIYKTVNDALKDIYNAKLLYSPLATEDTIPLDNFNRTYDKRENKQPFLIFVV